MSAWHVRGCSEWTPLNDGRSKWRLRISIEFRLATFPNRWFRFLHRLPVPWLWGPPVVSILSGNQKVWKHFYSFWTWNEPFTNYSQNGNVTEIFRLKLPGIKILSLQAKVFIANVEILHFQVIVLVFPQKSSIHKRDFISEKGLHSQVIAIKYTRWNF